MRPVGRLVATLLTLTVALPVASVAQTVGAVAADCSVRNARTGATVTSLKTAIKNAQASDRLEVSGTCVGAFVLTKPLRLVGTGVEPTLKGPRTGGTVLTVARKRVVKVIGLTITRGTGVRCPDWQDTWCGGGVINSGTLTLDRVIVRDNDLIPPSGDDAAYAAGIFNRFTGTMTILRSTIAGNTAISAAGWAQAGGIGNEGTLTIRRSTISGNLASGVGGTAGAGIYNSGQVNDALHNTVGDLVLENVTISGNSAADIEGKDGSRGGGILSESEAKRLAIRATTITDNGAGIGGGVYDAGTMTIIATVIAGNRDTDGAPDCAGSSPTASHTLIGIGAGCTLPTDEAHANKVGTVDSPIDPSLGTLEDNGGPTRTHALLGDSPALDAAGDGPCVTAIDQRGVARPAAAGCDIGAFERD